MADVDDRALGGSPCGEQGEAVRVDGLVPAAGPRRYVERLLHVDGEEDGVVEVEFHGRPNTPVVRVPPHKNGCAAHKLAACS